MGDLRPVSRLSGWGASRRAEGRPANPARPTYAAGLDMPRLRRVVIRPPPGTWLTGPGRSRRSLREGVGHECHRSKSRSHRRGRSSGSGLMAPGVSAMGRRFTAVVRCSVVPAGGVLSGPRRHRGSGHRREFHHGFESVDVRRGQRLDLGQRFGPVQAWHSVVQSDTGRSRRGDGHGRGAGQYHRTFEDARSSCLASSRSVAA